MDVSADHVRRAAAECCQFLQGVSDKDWTVPAPDLDMTVAAVVAHAAEGCLWYAIDLAAGGSDLEPVEHRVKVDASNEALLETTRAYSSVVAAVIDLSPNTARGFHPMGAADPSGFAAMACDELLIHTDDVARALDVEFHPTDELSAAVLTRLFPWISTNAGDPWELLRWANGRIDLPTKPRLDNWAWHCAPLRDWNGDIPTRPR